MYCSLDGRKWQKHSSKQLYSPHHHHHSGHPHIPPRSNHPECLWSVRASTLCTKLLDSVSIKQMRVIDCRHGASTHSFGGLVQMQRWQSLFCSSNYEICIFKSCYFRTPYWIQLVLIQRVKAEVIQYSPSSGCACVGWIDHSPLWRCRHIAVALRSPSCQCINSRNQSIIFYPDIS